MFIAFSHNRTNEKRSTCETFITYGERPEGVSVHEKRCPDCTQVKSKSDFRKRSTAKDGCQTYCKICDNTRSRKNRMRQK